MSELDLQPKRSDVAWFIVDTRDGMEMLLTFTAANRRKDAWRALENLYENTAHEERELARIAKQRTSGALRAVKATVTWAGR